MSVDRLSKHALQKILSGKVKEPVTCVVKFYSTTCPMCKNLKSYFEDISKKYEDIHFFAFNIADYPNVEKVLSFNGVPTISLIKTGRHQPKIRVLRAPEKPNPETWYTSNDISVFIDREK